MEWSKDSPKGGRSGRWGQHRAASIQISLEAGSNRATGSSLTGSQGQGDFNNWTGKRIF